MMHKNRLTVLDSITTDLMLEIFSRLPAKSVRRFCCLSKQWRSMLHKPYFTELFLTRSSARPRLLFGIKRHGELLLYSLPQPQNQYQKSSLVVAADFHRKFSKEISGCIWEYTSGLIYSTNKWNSMHDKFQRHVIYNPITGQCATLPDLQIYMNGENFLGFDPIDKQFKVLCINVILHCILTLGNEKRRWRKIHCPFVHYPLSGGICINGVLYYLAQQADKSCFAIICFDVRSEKFKLVETECFYHQLINYKGKLGGITLSSYAYDGGFPLQLRMWVLEDVEKQEWSKYVYILRPENNKVGMANYSNIYVVGMTATGDIVLSTDHTSTPFYVFYFNLKRKVLLSVEIIGEDQKWFKSDDIVYAFVDHVEDPKFSIM